jgi:hypothetical protein
LKEVPEDRREQKCDRKCPEPLTKMATGFMLKPNETLPASNYSFSREEGFAWVVVFAQDPGVLSS